jgi:hypothetical protein
LNATAAQLTRVRSFMECKGANTTCAYLLGDK